MTQHPSIRPRRIFATVAGLVALLPAQPACASDFEDPGAIDDAIATFTRAAIGEAGGVERQIDRRFRLAKCSAPPLVAFHGKARTSVSVSCGGVGGWRIFVNLTAGAPEDWPLVNRGEAVAVQVRGRGFTLSARGEALQSAGEGAAVPVRLIGPGREEKRLTAIVIGPGTVAVDLM